jgi:ADP-L-glycero-D-manno-heptose 6-epimerase
MIIVTGSKGFIGQNFLKALKDKEIKEVEKNDSWHFRQSFKDWNKVELILHQGAISHTTSTNLKALQHFNVEFSQWILQQAIKYQIPIKYASSASVYGHTLTDMNPLNYYAISKLTVDYWIQDHINEFSFIQAFRYFNVYGEGEENKGDQASPISKFTKQVKEDGKIKLFEGSDKFLRDFVFVDDVVDIVLNNDKPSGFYDLGTSNPTSFQEVGELIAKKYDGTIECIPFPEYLKEKYQKYTCAKKEWDYKFTTIKEYLQV